MPRKSFNHWMIMRMINRNPLKLLLLSLSLTATLVMPGLSAAGQTAPARASAPRASAPATLAELRSRIDEIVRQPALDPGFFAVKIVSLDSGQVLFEQDANKFVRPASNMKPYTVAAAFDLTIRPAEKVGAPVVISTGPPAKLFMSIVNHATTTERGSKSNLRIHRSVGSNNMEISGPLAIGDSGFTGGVAIPDPALAFV